ncbi:hypothetical protein C8F04DRAFT_1034927 [Mycena alexandri]|uniref:Transcription factor n=1 Tax=Mycena alexandri TaxID=1745969 RepID=A0AAD6T2V1_9AGAR|nr:hypothetical protein C8F04DRAFT_1034927 [Mycena alexandri]
MTSEHPPSRPDSPRPLVQQNHPSPGPSAPTIHQNPTSDIAPSAPSGSLQSILAPPPAQTPQTWLGPAPHENGAHPPQPSAGKRKLDSDDADDPHSKIRRIVRDHVSQDPSRVMPMTTVVCLHAAVAQKSYGSEKRFLCPPPLVHIDGPVWQMRRQELSMTVVSEVGERSFQQKAPLDNNMTSSFKFLHVTGTAKAKSFQLSLEIAEPSVPTSEGADPPPGRVWATFDSAPVTIISKPSKKTAKTRNISSCILAGGPVSLFNRINSQTVRTKYMTIDHAQLCASNVAWSAFNVNVVPRPTDPPSIGGPQPVTYGCSIILSDTHSGISTSPLIIRKVDKGRVSPDDGGPVSQMQKIALQRVNADGTRHYLSAAGPIPGAQGVVAPPAPGSSSQAGSHPLLFQSPRVRDEMKDGIRIVTDDVDDYLCWTIVGISKFQYTFFDAFGQNNNIPDMPITPFPTLFTAPVYRQTNNTIELTVANFFFTDPANGAHTPLDVYLGNLGPLRHRVYQASPPGPLTTVAPFINRNPGNGMDVADPAPAPNSPPSPSTPRFTPGPLHAIVIVEMPPLADVIKALEEDALPTGPEDGASNSRPSGPSDNAQQNGTHPPPSIAGRSLPLLFIRPSDGVGYHSGRTIACENVFQSLDMGGNPPNAAGNMDAGWLAAAQAAATADGGLHGWTLRVM